MSTFGGLNSAYSGLVAARTQIEVAGQNINNATTPGYTRQRVSLSSIPPLGTVGRVAAPIGTPGNGVAVTGIARLGDSFLDSRVRSTVSAASYSSIRASSLATLEKSLNEPGDSGISATLGDFWGSWQGLSNNVGNEASAAVVIEGAKGLIAQIATGYSAAAGQWQAMRSNADELATELNSAASQVAELNGLIRATLRSGGSANELIDHRNQLTTVISALSGGVVNERSDGTVDVLIGGNPIVSGTTANEVKVTGAYNIDAGPVQLEWSSRPGLAVSLEGGEIAGALSLLAQSNATGTGGAFAEAAASYNALATSLSSQVNALHSTGTTPTGAPVPPAPGLNFFGVSATGPAALGLSVIPTNSSGIATGAAGQGALDGSIADAISQIADKAGSPDSLWGTFVGRVAVTTKGELQQSKLADLSANSATAAQQSNASVDIDEENVNLLMAQTAYNGAARVFTAIDEMLDTLINRTGLVGR